MMRLASIGMVLLLTCTATGSARAERFVFPRSTPEAQGISSSAIFAFVEEAERTIDALHSVMIVRHGKVVAEGWWQPYAAGEPHMMFSLSKSFTSTAVGLAVAEGKLSVDDTVLSFFPDLAPAEPSANLKAMRVRDLLTMTAGHHQEDINGFPYQSEENVVGKFLHLPVAHKPGTFFLYNTPASYVLSAIVQKVTGQNLVEYLRPRLFEPLGIVDPAWDASKQGVALGGFGLNIRTEDIARFGQLYLQKGKWNGRQLVPAAWIEAATARQVSNGSSTSSDWEQGYGYQFWRSRHGFYRGDGAHGQFCLVLPQYDTVIAITAGTRDMGSVMNLVWDRLVPALGGKPLPADRGAHGRLTAKLAGLTLAPQEGKETTALADAVRGRRFAFETNAQAIEALALEPGAIALRMGGADQRLPVAPGAWRTGTLVVRGTPEPVAVSGAWTADDTYTLKICRYRTPFVTTYRLKPAGSRMTIEVEQNVGPADQRVTTLTGTSEIAVTGSR
jgi:CubicO group peptidase (beta-lactamase class C family)